MFMYYVYISSSLQYHQLGITLLISDACFCSYEMSESFRVYAKGGYELVMSAQNAFDES